MNAIIDQLIEIEEKAQKITTQAKQKKLALSEELKQKQEEMEKSIHTEYQIKIDKVKEQELLYQQQEIKRSNEKKEIQLEQMEKDFSENQSKWETDLFNKVIGG